MSVTDDLLVVRQRLLDADGDLDALEALDERIRDYLDSFVIEKKDFYRQHVLRDQGLGQAWPRVEAIEEIVGYARRRNL